jgi:cytochrome d ubiquinol oxidase subunit I
LGQVFHVRRPGLIGQTPAMEGMFAFSLESSFPGTLLFGEKKIGPRVHWVASLLLFLGSRLSGYFIIATNAWMCNILWPIRRREMGRSS